MADTQGCQPGSSKSTNSASATSGSIPEYRSLVESVGFRVISSKDLTEEWRPILKERLAMYQRLREEARQAGTPMGHDAFHKSYIRFVELIQQRKMGGVRIVASK